MNPTTSRISILSLVTACVVASVLFRLLAMGELTHSGLLFIGLPALCGYLMAFSGPALSMEGRVFKGLTLLLLLAGILVGEGSICILMSAPVFYLVAFLVIVLIKFGRKDKERDPPASLVSIVPLLVLSLEGVHEYTSLDRDIELVKTTVVNSPSQDIIESIQKGMPLRGDMPAFLQLGFPLPLDSGVRLDHDTKKSWVQFESTKGRSGYLAFFQQERHEADRSTFTYTLAEDDTVMSEWLTWQKIQIELIPSGSEQTKVVWTANWSRKLDPAWYFAPLETYGMDQAISYLFNGLQTDQFGSF